MNPGDIKISANFAVSTEQFIDGRMTVADVAALSTAFEFVPDGFETFVQSEGNWYQYDKYTNSWSPRPGGVQTSFQSEAVSGAPTVAVSADASPNHFLLIDTGGPGLTGLTITGYANPQDGAYLQVLVNKQVTGAFSILGAFVGGSGSDIPPSLYLLRYSADFTAWYPVIRIPASGSSTPNLQEVTSQGNETTNSITVVSDEEKVSVTSQQDLSGAIAAIGIGEIDSENESYVSLHNRDNVQGMILNRLMATSVNFDLPNTTPSENSNRVIPISVNGVYAEDDGNITVDGYLKYVAIINGLDGDEVGVIDLQNNTANTFNWSYSSGGNFSCTPATNFDLDKTVFFFSPLFNPSCFISIEATSGTLTVIPKSDSGGSVDYPKFNIEIRIYP
jgi:hypothetical protein